MNYRIVVTVSLGILLLAVACRPISLPESEEMPAMQTPTAEPEPESETEAEAALELSAEAENAAMVARQALAEELQIDAAVIETVSVEPMEWPDACLGLAAADEFCAAVIVPGYRVTLAVDDTQYVYRTNASAGNIRLEQAPM